LDSWHAMLTAAGPAILIGGAFWLVLKLIGWPKRDVPEDQKPKLSPPPALSRVEMIDGLRAMIDDPTTPENQREGARRRLEAFQALAHTRVARISRR